MRVPLAVRAVPSLTFRAWMTPPPLGRATRDRNLQSLAGLSPVHYGGVPGHEIGTGPLVIAVHGWGGRAAQMAPVARRLAEAGHRVVLPRIPGYAGGPPTDIKQAAAAVAAVIEDVGPPQLVVGHSFASMVLRLVFADAAPPRVALVAPALDINDALVVFGERLGLMPWAHRGLRHRLQTWDPVLWPTLSHSSPSQLPGARILIVHDPADADTPFSRSAELAATRPGTSIFAIEGAGHSKILSNETAVDRIAAFASATRLRRVSAA